MVTSRHNVNSYLSDWILVYASRMGENRISLNNLTADHCLCVYMKWMSQAWQRRKPSAFTFRYYIYDLCSLAGLCEYCSRKRMNATVSRVTFHGLNASGCIPNNSNKLINKSFWKFKQESLTNLLPFINLASAGCIMIYTSKDCFLFRVFLPTWGSPMWSKLGGD